MKLMLLWKFITSPFGKYLMLALAVAGAMWFGIHKFNDWKASLIEGGRMTGRAEVAEQYRVQVAENDKVNRLVEERLNGGLDVFFGRLDEKLSDVSGRGNAEAGSIAEQIKDNPELFANPACVTPKETLDSRNTIRRLGPQEIVK